MKEEWKQIPGYPDYMISNYGNILSLRSMSCLIPWEQKIGHHLMVSLSNKKVKRKHLVHRLVLTTFAGPAPVGKECSHLNGNPQDNRLCNLKWESHQNNMKRTEEHGTMLLGERNNFVKLTEEQVREIRKHPNIPQDKLGEMYGVRGGQISLIRNKLAWRHVK